MTRSVRIPDEGGEMGDAVDPMHRSHLADLSLDRFERALRAGRMGTWRWDIASGYVDWDRPMEELFGFVPGTFPGTYEAYAARLHPDDRPELERRLRSTLEQRRGEYSIEHRIVLPDGRVRWIASNGALVLDDDGAPAGLIGVAADVTRAHESESARVAAERAEQEARVAADRAQRRLALLARASQLLAVPLDVDVTLQKVADLLVEDLADWCVVEVDVDPGRRHVAVGHRDPAARDAVLPQLASRDEGLSMPRLREVPHTLVPLVAEHLEPDDLVRSITDPVRAEQVRAMRIESVIAVPLVAFGRGIGTLVLLLCAGRQLRPGDVDLAVDLGRRAGSAVEKARLYAERDRVARVLQRSLQPPVLHEPPGVEIAAAYRPWTVGMDVGGDYYDVFRLAGRWWFVLGDVCGKGPAAAALTAAVRYSLRALTLEDADPVSVLDRLNAVLLADEHDAGADTRFSTLVLGWLEPDDDGVTVQLASAGHPSPLVRRVTGDVVPVIATGLPVGLFVDLALVAAEVRLGPGEVLLLYTDGATEAPVGDDQLGEQTLRSLLARSTGRAEGVVADVLAGVLDRASVLRDDLALLALGVPPSAGDTNA